MVASVSPPGEGVLVVTGGTSGIGKAVADLATGPVVCWARCREGSSDGEVIRCDVSDADDVERAISATLDRFGAISGIVHSAGSRCPGGLRTLTVDAWDDCIATHVSSAFYVLRAATASLVETGGSMVLVSSAVAHRTVADSIAYATAKHALLHFARCAAAELGREGVRINCILPGFVDTPFHEQDPATATIARIPASRYADAQEIARAIIFLLEHPYANGAELLLDGGLNVGTS